MLEILALGRANRGLAVRAFSSSVACTKCWLLKQPHSSSNWWCVDVLAGSLIKLVYFSRHEDQSTVNKRKKTVKQRLGISNGNRRSYPILGGRLHFVKFETNKLNECLDFIDSKQLHRSGTFLLCCHALCVCTTCLCMLKSFPVHWHICLSEHILSAIANTMY